MIIAKHMSYRSPLVSKTGGAGNLKSQDKQRALDTSSQAENKEKRKIKRYTSDGKLVGSSKEPTGIGH
jgi:hypothetical protein